MTTAKHLSIAADAGIGPAARKRPAPRIRLLLGCVAVASTALTLVTLTGPGANAAAGALRFTQFYGGVLTLVTLTLSMMIGLAATDRSILLIRHRLFLQDAHRAMSFISVCGLVLHIVSKVMTGDAKAIDVAIPFLETHRTLYIGFGTIAAHLMLLTMWSGLARARFAGAPLPWLWRVLHTTAYLTWPVALTHGLLAGRQARPWVLVSYLCCAAFVTMAIAVRLAAIRGRWLAVPRAGRPRRMVRRPGPSTRGHNELANGTGSPVLERPVPRNRNMGLGRLYLDRAGNTDSLTNLAPWLARPGRDFAPPSRIESSNAEGTWAENSRAENGRTESRRQRNAGRPYPAHRHPG